MVRVTVELMIARSAILDATSLKAMTGASPKRRSHTAQAIRRTAGWTSFAKGIAMHPTDGMITVHRETIEYLISAAFSDGSGFGMSDVGKPVDGYVERLQDARKDTDMRLMKLADDCHEICAGRSPSTSNPAIQTRRDDKP